MTAEGERVNEYYLFSHGLFFRPEAKGYTGRATRTAEFY